MQSGRRRSTRLNHNRKTSTPWLCTLSYSSGPNGPRVYILCIIFTLLHTLLIRQGKGNKRETSTPPLLLLLLLLHTKEGLGMKKKEPKIEITHRWPWKIKEHNHTNETERVTLLCCCFEPDDLVPTSSRGVFLFPPSSSLPPPSYSLLQLATANRQTVKKCRNIVA